MILKRLLMPMLLLGIIFGLSSVAQAQTVLCTATSVPPDTYPALPRVALTGHTEPVGDVVVTCANTSATTAVVASTAVMTIDYGGTLQNSELGVLAPLQTATFAPMTLSNCTGNFVCGAASSAPGAGNGIGFLNGCSSCTAINVQLPALTWAGASAGSFKVTRVLESVPSTGKAAGGNLTATMFLATLGTGYDVSGAVDTVNTTAAIVDAIVDAGITRTVGPAVLTTNGLSFSQAFAITVSENYVDFFRTQTQWSPNAVSPGGGTGPNITGTGTFPTNPGQSTQVRFLFQNLPAGVSIGGCTASVAAVGSTTATASLSAVSVDATAPFTTAFFAAGAFDLTATDTITLSCTSATTTVTPLASATVTLVVSAAPCTTPTGSSATTTGCTAGGAGALTSLPTAVVPRYAASNKPTTAITVLTIAPATTTMLVPYAICLPGSTASSVSYDTGIAIANDTLDPFGPSLGGAVPQNGTITYNFFPSKATPFSFTTGATGTPAGNGGLTSGVLNAGDSYSVLTCDLVKAAGKTSFAGYIFVTTNFTNAHGIAFISSSFGPTTQTAATAFNSATPLLVMPPPSVVSRQIAGPPFVETLGQ
jgi:hypothetical protein